MSAPENWRFETKQIHSGAAARPGDEGPRHADLPDHVVRVRQRRPRGEPLRARRVRQHLHAHPEPDAGRRRGAPRRARGRHRRPPARERPGGRDRRGAQHRRGRRPHRLVELDLRRHVQPLQVHARQARHRDDVRREPGRRRGVARRGPPEHEALLRRDHRQPEDQRPRHPHRRRRRARERHPADRRQHDRDARTSSSRSSTAPTSSSTRRRSSSAATAPSSAASSSTAARSSGRRTSTSSRASPCPTRRYHGASYTAAVGDGLAYIIKARVQLLRDLGAAIAPQSAWLLIQGIETLSLRIERHVQNAQEIAEWLEDRERRRIRQLLGPAHLALVRRGQQVRARRASARCSRSSSRAASRPVASSSTR